MTVNDLKARLAAKYPPDAYALLFEVANETGYGHRARRRWADALVMSLWPSHGLHLSGMELKTSRTDWLRELKQPDKSSDIFVYCDHWYLVVSDRAIVKPGELPSTWGLMAPKGNGLAVVIAAPPLSPKPIDRIFLAAMLRAASKPAVKENRAALSREYNRGYENGVKSCGDRDKDLTQTIDRLRRDIDEFEIASGVAISHWPGGTKIGAVVRDVLHGVYDRDREDLAEIRRTAAEIIQRIDAVASNGRSG